MEVDPLPQPGSLNEDNVQQSPQPTNGVHITGARNKLVLRSKVYHCSVAYAAWCNSSLRSIWDSECEDVRRLKNGMTKLKHLKIQSINI